MDTTIRNLDDDAYRRIKARAALEGRTLGEAVSEAIRRYVESEAAGARGPRRAERLAGEVAEAGREGGYGDAVAAPGDQAEGAGVGLAAPPTLGACFERLAELARPDARFLDELEAIQAAQPPLGPEPWES